MALHIRRLAHVNLSVDDVERARWFYGEVLGLEEIARAEGGRPGAWFRLGSVELHLSLEPHASGESSKRHVCFEVRELTAVVEQLRASGLRIEGGSPLPGIVRLFTRDPSGNRIEFQQDAGKGGRCG